MDIKIGITLLYLGDAYTDMFDAGIDYARDHRSVRKVGLVRV